MILPGRFFPALTVILLSTSSAQSQLMDPDTLWVNETIQSMTLDEKIGQLFMPVHTNLDRTLEWIKKFSIGGIWFARTEKNTIAGELNTLQRSSKYPLLVSADFEKGVGTYVDGTTDLPINMALGASRDPEIVRQAAALTARESRALGVHINFAPVLDVNNNRKNPIINTRSFGESPGLVADLGKAAVRGYQENGMMATAKHFPGHGNITVDSHAKLGIIESSPDAFSSVELFPFRSIIEECKIDNIMTAHLWVKAIDKDTMPATLSQGVVTDLLREKMHFSGVIYTDAMVMGAITNRYSPEEATVRALLAGCDVILYPPNVEVGITAVKSALKSGSLTEARIDESVRRILISKTKVGIHRQRFTNTEQLASLAGTPEQSSTAKFIASRCLTLVKDDQKLIPLKSDQRIFVLTVSNKSANAIISRWLVSFPEEMKRNSSRIDVRQLSDELKSDEMDRAIAQAKKADVVIVAAYIKIILSSGNIELPPQLELFIRRLSEVNQQLVVISFGNPYIGASIPGGAAYICTYDNARALQDVAADAIYGKIPFLGKLPISISDSLRAGSGIQLKWN